MCCAFIIWSIFLFSGSVFGSLIPQHFDFTVGVCACDRTRHACDYGCCCDRDCLYNTKYCTSTYHKFFVGSCIKFTPKKKEFVMLRPTNDSMVYEESGFNIKNFNEEYGFSCSSNTYNIKDYSYVAAKAIEHTRGKNFAVKFFAKKTSTKAKENESRKFTMTPSQLRLSIPLTFLTPFNNNKIHQCSTNNTRQPIIFPLFTSSGCDFRDFSCNQSASLNKTIKTLLAGPNPPKYIEKFIFLNSSENFTSVEKVEIRQNYEFKASRPTSASDQLIYLITSLTILISYKNIGYYDNYKTSIENISYSYGVQVVACNQTNIGIKTRVIFKNTSCPLTPRPLLRPHTSFSLPTSFLYPFL